MIVNAWVSYNIYDSVPKASLKYLLLPSVPSDLSVGLSLGCTTLLEFRNSCGLGLKLQKERTQSIFKTFSVA